MDSDKSSRRKKRYVIGLTCAIVFVALYFIINLPTISSFFGGVINILMPIIIGAVIAYMLNPILKFYEFRVFKKMKNKSLCRFLSIFLTYISAGILLILLFLLLIPQLIDSIKDLISKFDYYVETTSNAINNFISRFNQNGELNHYISEESIKDFLANFFSITGSILETVFSYLQEYAMGIFIGVKNALLGFFISIYMLGAKERLYAQFRKGCSAFLGPKTSHTFRRYLRLTNRTVSGFFVGKVVDSAIIFLLTLVLLLIFRMPYSLLVSTIVGITNVVPVFGPIVGAIPSAIIIFIASPQKALIFLVLILIIQQIDGNIIGPKILGESTGLSSLGVIIAVTIMGECFGILGMIVGVPLFAMFVIIIKQFVETRLHIKNLPVDTAEYYANDSLVDPHEEHENITVRLFTSMKGFFLKLFGKAKKATIEKEKKKNGKSEP